MGGITFPDCSLYLRSFFPLSIVSMKIVFIVINGAKTLSYQGNRNESLEVKS